MPRGSLCLLKDLRLSMNTLSSPADLALDHIRSLHAYVPGLQPQDANWVKLNTNENPYPASPLVGEAIAKEFGRLHLYPAPDSKGLRHAIAAHHGLEREWVIAANGSDDTLNMLMRAFCGVGAETAAGWTFPSYSLYPTLIGIQGGKIIGIPFTRSMELPIASIIESKARIFFLTSPNAPTGVAFSNDSIRAILDQYEGILVVDEAYADFAGENAVALLSKYPNLVITRTFSKSYSLAGLRVGYGLAHPAIISILDRVRDSYNLDRLAQAGAIAALQDQAYFRQTVSKIVATREAFLSILRGLGWYVYPSQTNFVFFEPQKQGGVADPAVAKELFDFLLSKKVLVRYFPSHSFTASFLRVSIGTDAEMARVEAVLREWLSCSA